MNKLRLDLDALDVATFETAAAETEHGTVRGHDIPTNPYCAAVSYKSYCPDTLCTCPPPRD